jgi:type IV pilus modification protein PilV
MTRSCNDIFLYRGTTLVEVLIAVVILSAGLLATGLIYIESISALTRNTHTQRAQRMAADLAEAVTQLSAHTDITELSPTTAVCDASIVCNPQQLLNTLFVNWQQQLAQQLPAGYGSVTIKEFDGQPAAVIKINWEARNSQTITYEHIAATQSKP